MTPYRRTGRALASTTILAAVLALAAPANAVAPAAGEPGEVYVLHGLAGVEADILVDGTVMETAAEAKTIVGPLELSPGAHEITLAPTDEAAADLTAQVTVEAGASIDVVGHSSADPTAPPTVTVFPNDLSPVAPGKARLAVAHTAAVPPADIRVNGDVLFSNVANGEALTLLVPGDTYTVDIVPTGADSPVVFGPVDLPVAAGQLNRVFAFGDPEENNMDAVVHTLPVPVEGGDAPGMVETGSGGQAIAADDTSRAAVALLGIAGLLVAAVAALAFRRRVRA